MSENNISYHVSSFKKGEDEGISFFFREYYALLCFYANKLIKNKCVAEEIASEAFIKIQKHRQQFSNATQIRSYLVAIVRNECYKWLSKQSGNRKKQKEYLYLVQGVTEQCHYEAIVTAELLNNLYKAGETLAPECKKIFQKMYVEGKKSKEISKELDVAVSTVKNQKSRAIIKLRKKFSF